jgi:hypothetical protein
MGSPDAMSITRTVITTCACFGLPTKVTAFTSPVMSDSV